MKNSLVTDCSKTGIGFILLQQHCTCNLDDAPFCCTSGWKVALCSSQHLQDAETRYAVIEGEALAITWGLKKAHNYLSGCPQFIIATDHKPLISIFSNKNLGDIANPRLMKMEEKTLQYSFAIKQIEGKYNDRCQHSLKIPSYRS